MSVSRDREAFYTCRNGHPFVAVLPQALRFLEIDGCVDDTHRSVFESDCRGGTNYMHQGCVSASRHERCCIHPDALPLKSKIVVLEEGSGIVMCIDKNIRPSATFERQLIKARTAIICTVCNEAWCLIATKGTVSYNSHSQPPCLTLFAECCGTAVSISDLALTTEILQPEFRGSGLHF